MGKQSARQASRLFTERDIKGMSRAFDLTDYKAVKARAEAIRDRIRGIGGAVMPPPPPVGDELSGRLGDEVDQAAW
jgi:hypothetical protein